jgi:hypothetical protein
MNLIRAQIERAIIRQDANKIDNGSAREYNYEQYNHRRQFRHTNAL